MFRDLPSISVLGSGTLAIGIALSISLTLMGCAGSPVLPARVEDRSSLIKPDKPESLPSIKPTQSATSSAPAKREKESATASSSHQNSDSKSSETKSSESGPKSKEKNKEESEAVATPLSNDDAPVQAQSSQQTSSLQAQSQASNPSAAPVQPNVTGATHSTANPIALPPITWVWPSDLPVAQGFSEVRKGIDFAGSAGQPVRSVASGVATYVGNSLRGYGQMLVIKHDQGFISVYANNSKILVKEGQKIERAQKIAETGHADGSDVALHFEIRQQGKPLDPTGLFPTRTSN